MRDFTYCDKRRAVLDSAIFLVELADAGYFWTSKNQFITIFGIVFLGEDLVFRNFIFRQ